MATNALWVGSVSRDGVVVLERPAERAAASSHRGGCTLTQVLCPYQGRAGAPAQEFLVLAPDTERKLQSARDELSMRVRGSARLMGIARGDIDLPQADLAGLAVVDGGAVGLLERSCTLDQIMFGTPRFHSLVLGVAFVPEVGLLLAHLLSTTPQALVMNWSPQGAGLDSSDSALLFLTAGFDVRVIGVDATAHV